MVNNFTANLKRRKKDVYSPGGIPGRPDRATIVYADRVHALYPEIPLVIGGIEASLRRFAHYDYWQLKRKRRYIYKKMNHFHTVSSGTRTVQMIYHRKCTMFFFLFPGGEGPHSEQRASPAE